MGLDTTHGAWNGPYSHFNDFRYWLAQRIGIDLDQYIGYCATGTKDLESIDHPLKPLFNHSDCDGVLTADQCAQIAFGLEEVIDDIRLDELEGNFLNQHYYQCAEQFKEGCKLAALKNENIEFL